MMSRSTPLSACTGPKCLLTPRSWSSGAVDPLPEGDGSTVDAWGAWPASAGRAPSELPEGAAASGVIGFLSLAPSDLYLIPYLLQSAAYLPVQIWLAGTNPSLTTLIIVCGVTHSGVSSTDGTDTLCALGFVVWPLMRLLGGVLPARR